MSKKIGKRTNLVCKKLDIAFALKQYSEGSPELYNKLLKQLSQDVPVDVLKSYLKELIECVTILDERFYDFVRIILNLNWYTSESLCKKYFSFVVSLSIAQPIHLANVLTTLVTRFKPNIDPLQSVVNQQRQHLTICGHVHLALKSIQERVPMMQNTLMPIIIKLFPYFKHDVFQIECYVRNLLQLTLFMPSVRFKILELIIAKITNFDVSCPRQDIIKSEKEEEEEMSDSVFQIELDKNPDVMNPLMKLPEAEVLDILMNLLLTYIENICYNSFESSNENSCQKLNWSNCKRLFRELLLIFENIILPTHATCHVQFIFFYICKYNVQLCDGFLDFLWKKFHNPNMEAVFRQACASYLGSFLARSIYLPTNTMIMCLDEFCNWIHYYIDLVSLPKDRKHSLLISHGPFYYLCQAVFYVFVFRHRDLFESTKGCHRITRWNFQRIVTCHLNPLKFCAQNLVEKFACIMRLYQLAMCDTIIERNRREILNDDSLEVFAAEKSGSLDSFFPFDPCLLPRTNKFIKPLFREYDGVESHLDSVTLQAKNDDEVDFLPPEVDDRISKETKEFSFSGEGSSTGILGSIYEAGAYEEDKRGSRPLFDSRNELIEEMMASL